MFALCFKVIKQQQKQKQLTNGLNIFRNASLWILSGLCEKKLSSKIHGS